MHSRHGDRQVPPPFPDEAVDNAGAARGVEDVTVDSGNDATPRGPEFTVLGLDPGPLARMMTVMRDASAPDVIVQRLAAGESLKDIASSWGLPYQRFLAWIAANGELTEQCKRVREIAGVELRFEGMQILDDAKADKAEVQLAAEQAKYRERLSRDLNKPLFGRLTTHKHEVTIDLGERLRRARERVIEQAGEPETTPAESSAASAPSSIPAPADATI